MKRVEIPYANCPELEEINENESLTQNKTKHNSVDTRLKLTLFTKGAQGFSPFGPTPSQFPETNSLVMICHDSFGESAPSSAVLNHPSFSYLWSTDMRTASYLFVPSPVARLAWIRNQFLVLRYLADGLIGGLEYPLSF